MWIGPIPPGITVTELMLLLMLSSPLAHILAHGCLTFIEMYTKYQFREGFSWLLKRCGLVTKLSFVFHLFLHGY